MKYQWSLLLLPLLAGPVLAQQPEAAPMTPVAPTFNPAEAPSCAPGFFDWNATTTSDPLSGNHNFVNFINWMSNPLANIDPRAVTAIYPMFGSVWVSNTPPIPNADAQLYGPAFTVALSDRFAMGLNEGGFLDAHFSRNPIQRQRLFNLDPQGRFRNVETSSERDGWLNIGGFFQYTLIEDVKDQFILSGGLRWEVPCGSYEVFQGHGPAELAPYLTAGKEFGLYHVLATTGYQFPAGPGNDNVKVFYANVHIDRQLFGWLYPLVEFNSNFLSKSGSLGLNTQHGLFDFGNFEAEGNVVSMAAGANAVLIPEHLEFGAVYTTVIASQRNFNANGMLVKMTIRY